MEVENPQTKEGQKQAAWFRWPEQGWLGDPTAWRADDLGAS